MSDTIDPRQDRVRVLLIDALPIARAGLRAVLGEDRRLEVVGEAGTVAEGLRLAEGLHPDVAVVDGGLADPVGVAATARLKVLAPGLRVLVFSRHAEPVRGGGGRWGPRAGPAGQGRRAGRRVANRSVLANLAICPTWNL